MSFNSNNTAATVLATAADKAKVKEAKAVSQDISSIVLSDAIRAVKDTDSANFAFSTSVLAMCLDSLARKVARSEEFKPGKDGKLSPTILKSNSDVLFALQVRSTYLGLQVYLGTKDHSAEIAGMFHGNAKAKEAKIKAARELVDGTWVLGGKMLPLGIDPTKDTSGQYVGATRKAMVSSFATARRMSAFLVSWFWHNRSDVIRDFAERREDGKYVNLNADDVAMIRAIVSDTFGTTFAELENAYKIGRPAPAPRAGLVERIQKSAEKATLDEVQALAAYFQAKFGQMTAAAADADASVGLDNMPDDVIVGYDDEETAIAA